MNVLVVVVAAFVGAVMECEGMERLDKAARMQEFEQNSLCKSVQIKKRRDSAKSIDEFVRW